MKGYDLMAKYKISISILIFSAVITFLVSCGKEDTSSTTVTVDDAVVEESSPADEAADEVAKTVRKKKIQMNPLELLPAANIEINDDVLGIQPREQIEKDVDEMLDLYRSMSSEEKSAMLEKFKRIPALLTKFKYNLKLNFEKMSSEDKAIEQKILNALRPYDEEVMNIAYSKMSESEKQELAPLFIWQSDIANYMQSLLDGTDQPIENLDEVMQSFEKPVSNTPSGAMVIGVDSVAAERQK